jgi:hypothetical protein
MEESTPSGEGETLSFIGEISLKLYPRCPACLEGGKSDNSGEEEMSRKGTEVAANNDKA